MATTATTTTSHHEERDAVFRSLYNEYTTSGETSLRSVHLAAIYERIREKRLNIGQVEASMRYVCSSVVTCDEEELIDVLREMDRRYGSAPSPKKK